MAKRAEFIVVEHMIASNIWHIVDSDVVINKKASRLNIGNTALASMIRA